MDEDLYNELMADAGERMKKSVEATRNEFATVRTGRASPHLLDRVNVDYYGAITPLKQLASISASEARLLTITPYDKSSIKAIEKSILESDVGLTPSNDGNLIRLTIPELTEERRKELVKVVHGIAEEGRVGVRNVRREVMHDLREHEEGGRPRRRRRAPGRDRAPEAHRHAHRRDRQPAGRQGRGDPRRCDRPRGAAGTSRSSPTATGAGHRRGGCEPIEGHRAGADVVKERLRDAARLGVEELTVFSFSTENWTRPAAEVAGLMEMFGERIDRETPELHEEGVRMRFIGRREGVPAELREKMEWAEGVTRGQHAHHAVRGVQLRRQGGDRGRGAKLPG